MKRKFKVQHPHTVAGTRANCHVRCLGDGLATGFYPVEHPKTTIDEKLMLEAVLLLL